MEKALLLAIALFSGTLSAELCYKYSSGRIKFVRNRFDGYKEKLKGIRTQRGVFYVQQNIPLSFKPPKGYLSPLTVKTD